MSFDSDSEISDLDELITDDDRPLVAPRTRTSTRKSTAKSSAAEDIRALPKARNSGYNFRSLYENVRDKVIILDPEYQRGVVWNDAKQIGLIDSAIHNYYIPPIIFACQKIDGKEIFICIDGKQRITSIQRFMDGEIYHKDSFSGKKAWFCKAPGQKHSSRNLFDAEQRKAFERIQIVCVEYDNITEDQEREIFQRVQLGVALTPAERLRAITGVRSTLIRDFQSRVTGKDGFGQYLDWGKTRAKDFQCLAQIAFLIDIYPKTTNPSSFQLETWLHDTKPLTAAFHDNFTKTIDIYIKLARDPQLSLPFNKNRDEARVSPVEFTFIGLLIYVYNSQLSEKQLAAAITKQRADVRAAFTDIRTNTPVVKHMVAFIKKLPSTSWWRQVQGQKELPASETVRVPSESAEILPCKSTKRKRVADAEDSDAQVEIRTTRPKTRVSTTSKSTITPRPATLSRSTTAVATASKVLTETDSHDDTDDQPIRPRKTRVVSTSGTSKPQTVTPRLATSTVASASNLFTESDDSEDEAETRPALSKTRVSTTSKSTGASRPVALSRSTATSSSKLSSTPLAKCATTVKRSTIAAVVPKAAPVPKTIAPKTTSTATIPKLKPTPTMTSHRPSIQVATPTIPPAASSKLPNTLPRIPKLPPSAPASNLPTPTQTPGPQSKPPSPVIQTKELGLGPSLSSRRASLPSISVQIPRRKVISNPRTASQSSVASASAAPPAPRIPTSAPVPLPVTTLAPAHALPSAPANIKREPEPQTASLVKLEPPVSAASVAPSSIERFALSRAVRAPVSGGSADVKPTLSSSAPLPTSVSAPAPAPAPAPALPPPIASTSTIIPEPRRTTPTGPRPRLVPGNRIGSGDGDRGGGFPSDQTLANMTKMFNAGSIDPHPLALAFQRNPLKRSSSDMSITPENRSAQTSPVPVSVPVLTPNLPYLSSNPNLVSRQRGSATNSNDIYVNTHHTLPQAQYHHPESDYPLPLSATSSTFSNAGPPPTSASSVGSEDYRNRRYSGSYDVPRGAVDRYASQDLRDREREREWEREWERGRGRNERDDIDYRADYPSRRPYDQRERGRERSYGRRYP